MIISNYFNYLDIKIVLSLCFLKEYFSIKNMMKFIWIELYNVWDFLQNNSGGRRKVDVGTHVITLAMSWQLEIASWVQRSNLLHYALYFSCF